MFKWRLNIITEKQDKALIEKTICYFCSKHALLCCLQMDFKLTRLMRLNQYLFGMYITPDLQHWGNTLTWDDTITSPCNAMPPHLSTFECELCYCLPANLPTAEARWAITRSLFFDIMRHLFTVQHAETLCLIVNAKMPDGCEDTSEPEDSCVNISLTRHRLS